MQFSLRNMLLAVACFAVALFAIMPHGGRERGRVALVGIAIGAAIGFLFNRPLVGILIGLFLAPFLAIAGLIVAAHLGW